MSRKIYLTPTSKCVTVVISREHTDNKKKEREMGMNENGKCERCLEPNVSLQEIVEDTYLYKKVCEHCMRQHKAPRVRRIVTKPRMRLDILINGR